ncbi:MAG TPA: phosphotransferase [Desulfatiglandales bacterium]|nr:phosphotransferase [Desulfatiglandales bacterium]
MELKEFFKSYLANIGVEDEGFTWSRLGGDGSNRIFYRLSNNKYSFIIMEHPPAVKNAEKENISYLKIGKHLLSRGIPVARIYKYDLKYGWFIMEDLGERNLQEVTLNSNNLIEIYKKVVELLVEIQLEGREGFDTDWCYQTKRYDEFVMKRLESDYFLTYFLKGFLELKQDLSALRRSFEYLAQHASLANNDFFLHRDFQSRNIMINGDNIGIVDWQGGRLGPLQYDLASLLIDPYVGLENNHRAILYDYYLKLIEGRIPGISDSFIRYYPYLAIQRNLQILGAFSYLGKIQGKKWFLSYIPPALKSLDGLLESIDETELYPLKKLIRETRNRLKT